MNAPPGVLVVNANTKRETGKKAQYGNIAAAKARRGPDVRDHNLS